MAYKSLTIKQLKALKENVKKLIPALREIESIDDIDYPKDQGRIFLKIRATIGMHLKRRLDLEAYQRAVDEIVSDIDEQIKKLGVK